MATRRKSKQNTDVSTGPKAMSTGRFVRIAIPIALLFIGSLVLTGFALTSETNDRAVKANELSTDTAKSQEIRRAESIRKSQEILIPLIKLPSTQADDCNGNVTTAADFSTSPSPAVRPIAAPVAPAYGNRVVSSAYNQNMCPSCNICQAPGLGCTNPAAPCPTPAVDCATCDQCRRRGWEAARLIMWQEYAQGEYCGRARTVHVDQYRLRPEDELDFTYRLTREKSATPYKLNIGDMIQVESFTDEDINRELLIQPDGMITMRLLGQVPAAGLTVTQLRDELEQRYSKYYKVPAITVTPTRVDTRLEDLRAAVNSQFSPQGGQNRSQRVSPSGEITLPMVGSVKVQGLTIPEVHNELNERYRELINGIEVMPSLIARAPRYVYVLGEVAAPGRYELTGPTTLTGAIAMAGSWLQGANLKRIVIFRRGDDWRLLAAKVNIQDALYGVRPCPKGEIWVGDSDVIIVPKSSLQLADDFIDMVFTRGIYGVFPISSTINFAKLSTL